MRTVPPLNIDTSYDSTIDAVYAEAWKKTEGFKAQFWQALVSIILMIIAALNLSIVLKGIIPINNAIVFYVVSQFIHFAILLLLLMPLFAGLLMMGIKYVINIPAPINTIFHYFSYWKRLWILPLVIVLLSITENLLTGFTIYQIVLFTAFIIWGALHCFSIPLCIEKNYSLSMALDVARKTLLQHWVEVFSFFLTAFIILLGSAFTLGIGLIWTLPWLFNAFAIFYRELFGVQMSLV
jgi:hypothetical protein